MLYQITPIPIFLDSKLYMLNENEELIAKRKDEFLPVKNCVKNRNKYYCNIDRQKTIKCFINIINKLNNNDCKYHKIDNPTFILKIRNADIAIIASN